MLNLKQVLQDLETQGRARFVISSELYSLRLTERGHAQVSTMVFRGEPGFLPKSVKEAVIKASIIDGMPEGSRFDLDLESGVVLIQTKLRFERRSQEKLAREITEFVFLSEEWRDHLNDQGNETSYTSRFVKRPVKPPPPRV